MEGIYSQQRAIVVDLGGTRFRVAVGNPSGALEWRTSKFTRVERGLSPVLEELYQTVDEALSKVPDQNNVTGLAIAAPGPLDPHTGVIFSPPNMPGWDRVPIKKLFEERFKLPVRVENDANMAAVGEYRYGSGKGKRHVVYITVSTGIGGGIISDGRLLLGAGGFAGEIGHMTVDVKGERCSCGNVGCLEWLASGTSIARRARQRAKSGVRSALRGLPREEITAKLVSELAYQGDRLAEDVLRDAGVALGVGIVNLAHLFNPERVILGGGVALNAGPILWDAIHSTIRARAMPSSQQGLDVVPAALGDDAGLLGGVALLIPPEKAA
ncbi:MAG: ROK family protein [Chloroflexota bacterium]|jgi:glucokinase